MSSQHTTKGIYLKSIVKVVRKERGQEGIKQLQKIYGDIKFSGFDDYPVSEEIRLNKAVLQVLYRDESPESWRKFGYLSGVNYANSIIGKTMFSLMGNDLKKLVFAIERIFNTVTTGYTIKVDDLGNNKLRILIMDCPDNINYLQGIFEATIRYFGSIPSVSHSIINFKDYEYIIEWK